jgi:hypothetical protein
MSSIPVSVSLRRRVILSTIHQQVGYAPYPQYLGAIASGLLKYLVWEPEHIAVRVYAESAVLRHMAKLEMAWEGKRNPPGRFWHTDAYEKRSGRRQVVLSQATFVDEK